MWRGLDDFHDGVFLHKLKHLRPVGVGVTILGSWITLVPLRSGGGHLNPLVERLELCSGDIGFVSKDWFRY